MRKLLLVLCVLAAAGQAHACNPVGAGFAFNSAASFGFSNGAVLQQTFAVAPEVVTVPVPVQSFRTNVFVGGGFRGVNNRTVIRQRTRVGGR